MPVRRKLFVAAGSAAVFTVLLLPLCEPPPLETGAYVQAVTGHRAVICCWTAEPVRRGLRIRSGEDVIVTTAPGEPAVQHQLGVGDLTPATVYDYDVLDADGAVVDRGRFVTRSDDDTRPVHFAIIGDSGGQPWWIALRHAPLLRLLRAHRWLPTEDEPRAVARVLGEIAPDFWLHTGDVIYPAGERTHYWTGLYEPFGELLRRAPLYPVPGNHDCMTDDGAPFDEQFVLPRDDGPAADGPGHRNFTFRDGPIRFVGLDLNSEVGPDHPALAFLRRVAATSSEPWLLVWSHYPVQSAYRDHPRLDLEEHYLPLCRELGVDLVCAGHDHNYQRFGEPGETIQVVSGGGGKSLYEILYRPPGLVATGVAYHACDVEIRGAVLHLTARAVDGAILDEFTIDKAQLFRAGQVDANPARLDRIRALAN